MPHRLLCVARKFFAAAILCAIALIPHEAVAQNAARNQVAGTITAVDSQKKQVSVKTDQGETVTANATDRTLVLRIPPGETDAKKGTKISLSDVSAGDRVVAVSKQPIEGKTMDASALLVMSKSDV